MGTSGLFSDSRRHASFIVFDTVSVKAEVPFRICVVNLLVGFEPGDRNRAEIAHIERGYTEIKAG